jgi:hypothetical protein
MKITLLAILLFVVPSRQDIYMHNPRGSNNRLNEKSANRANGNRVFDSQVCLNSIALYLQFIAIVLNNASPKNNDRGGYNVGDATSDPFTDESQQYQMVRNLNLTFERLLDTSFPNICSQPKKYFQSSSSGQSYVDVEWTAQHGCGIDQPANHSDKVNCDLIIQYMCQPLTNYASDNLDRIRDGLNTNTQDYATMTDPAAETPDVKAARKSGAVKLDRVLQETWESYDACNYRERNRGLFTADQNLKKNDKGYSSAIYTRQNPNGERNGYECPEERDYYPYWHPSEWKDVAILTNRLDRCDQWTNASSNVAAKSLCVEYYPGGSTQKHWSRWNNPNECAKNGGTWAALYNYHEKAVQFKSKQSCEANGQAYKWAVPYDSANINAPECLILLSAPECREAQ